MSGEIDWTPGKRWQDPEEPITYRGLDATGQGVGKVRAQSISAVELQNGAVGNPALDANTLAAVQAALGKNYLLNPRFDLWTRKNVYTYSTYAAGSYTHLYAADRWLVPNSTNRTWSRQAFNPAQASVPNFPVYFLRWAQTAAVSVNPAYFGQRVEGVQTLAGQTATFAIWVRCDTAFSVQCQISQHFGVGGSPDNDLAVQSFALTPNVWRQLVYTVAIPSIAGKVVDLTTDTYLEVRVILPQGATFQIDFSQGQLTLGDSATYFEYRPVLRELSMCNWYFERTQAPLASVISDILPAFYFNAPKRIIPALSIESVTTGTGGAVTPLSINGFYQSVVHSALAFATVLADCELYPS